MGQERELAGAAVRERVACAHSQSEHFILPCRVDLVGCLKLNLRTTALTRAAVTSLPSCSWRRFVIMKCLYEVLGVSQDAEDGAIRTAYRKLALRFHPGD